MTPSRRTVRISLTHDLVLQRASARRIEIRHDIALSIHRWGSCRIFGSSCKWERHQETFPAPAQMHGRTPTARRIGPVKIILDFPEKVLSKAVTPSSPIAIAPGAHQRKAGPKAELRPFGRVNPLAVGSAYPASDPLIFVTTSFRYGSVRRFPTGEVHTDRDYLPATSKYHRQRPAGCSSR